MKRSILILLIIFTLPGILFSQFKNERPVLSVGDLLRMPSTYGNGLLLGIVDLSKIEMSHSYSTGYFSGGGNSSTYGMYMNSMRYPVSDKLLLNLDLGYVHDPFQSFSAPSEAAFQGGFIGAGEITYSPTKNMHLQLRISNLPYDRRSPYSGYRRY